MATSNPCAEEISSQLPALQLLINLGWTYLTPAKALQPRFDASGMILTGMLKSWYNQD